MADEGKASSRVRVERALAELGIAAEIVEFPHSTRTSAEAAAAIGCGVAQICKSIVLRGMDSGEAVIVIASGSNRVDEGKVRHLVGEAVGKADAAFVREATGFAIGGVAPVGHTRHVRLVVDRSLLELDPVWAAAGTPSSVFRLASADLGRLPGAVVGDVSQDRP